MQKLATEIFNEDYKIKRIVKPLFDYIRISVNKNLPNDIINNGINEIAEKLNAAVREQSLKRRRDLESVSKSVIKHIGSIITLNINGIKGKYYELSMSLERYKPDFICLQKTKNLVKNKRIHLDGYLVHEVPASGTGLGLLMGFRKDSNISYNILESNTDVILASVNGRNIVGNIYRSSRSDVRKITTKKIVNILNNYSDKSDILLVGDWNETPSVMQNKLLKKGIQVHTTNAPIKGTRINPDCRRTKRPTDYGLSNNNQMIISQLCRYNWMISDHLPIEVMINMNHNTTGDEKTLLFDRKRLYDNNIIKALKDHDYKVSGQDPVGDIKVFHEELNKTLRDLKVIREITISDRTLIVPKNIKRAIALKRDKDKKVRKGLISISRLAEAKKFVVKQIRAHKRKSYLRFIMKGINYLKHSDTKNAWKWVKTHSGIGKNKLSVDQVYKHGTQETEADSDERLKIWADHFRKLSIAGPSGSEINNSAVFNIGIAEITDSQVSWAELQTVLKCMRKGKAAGNDMIPGEVYKLVENETTESSQFAKSILMILNNVYNDGLRFPSEWKDCTVVPIFKKGDRLDPNNYRGIALINTLLKVLIKVIAGRLQDVCCNYNLIKREQVGFIRSEESTAQVACLLESCQRRKIRDKNTLLCFLDLRKAYDLVPHERLLSKLQSVGLGHKMINFIRRMYDNTFMRVRIGNNLTEPFRYERGVR